jgi:hypothetical protein
MGRELNAVRYVIMRTVCRMPRWRETLSLTVLVLMPAQLVVGTEIAKPKEYAETRVFRVQAGEQLGSAVLLVIKESNGRKYGYFATCYHVLHGAQGFDVYTWDRKLVAHQDSETRVYRRWDRDLVIFRARVAEGLALDTVGTEQVADEDAPHKQSPCGYAFGYPWFDPFNLLDVEVDLRGRADPDYLKILDRRGPRPPGSDTNLDGIEFRFLTKQITHHGMSGGLVTDRDGRFAGLVFGQIEEGVCLFTPAEVVIAAAKSATDPAANSLVPYAPELFSVPPPFTNAVHSYLTRGGDGGLANPEKCALRLCNQAGSVLGTAIYCRDAGDRRYLTTPLHLLSKTGVVTLQCEGHSFPLNAERFPNVLVLRAADIAIFSCSSSAIRKLEHDLQRIAVALVPEPLGQSSYAAVIGNPSTHVSPTATFALKSEQVNTSAPCMIRKRTKLGELLGLPAENVAYGLDAMSLQTWVTDGYNGAPVLTTRLFSDKRSFLAGVLIGAHPPARELCWGIPSETIKNCMEQLCRGEGRPYAGLTSWPLPALDEGFLSLPSSPAADLSLDSSEETVLQAKLVGSSGPPPSVESVQWKIATVARLLSDGTLCCETRTSKSSARGDALAAKAAVFLFDAQGNLVWRTKMCHAFSCGGASLVREESWFERVPRVAVETAKTMFVFHWHEPTDADDALLASLEESAFRLELQGGLIATRKIDDAVMRDNLVRYNGNEAFLKFMSDTADKVPPEQVKEAASCFQNSPDFERFRAFVRTLEQSRMPQQYDEVALRSMLLFLSSMVNGNYRLANQVLCWGDDVFSGYEPKGVFASSQRKWIDRYRYFAFLGRSLALHEWDQQLDDNLILAAKSPAGAIEGARLDRLRTDASDLLLEVSNLLRVHVKQTDSERFDLLRLWLDLVDAIGTVRQVHPSFCDGEFERRSLEVASMALTREIAEIDGVELFRKDVSKSAVRAVESMVTIARFVERYDTDQARRLYLSGAEVTEQLAAKGVKGTKLFQVAAASKLSAGRLSEISSMEGNRLIFEGLQWVEEHLSHTEDGRRILLRYYPLLAERLEAAGDREGAERYRAKARNVPSSSAK